MNYFNQIFFTPLKSKLKPRFLSTIFLLLISSFSNAQTLLEHVEIETGTLLPGYTGTTATPFTGVVMYANGDGVELTTAKFSNAPGIFKISIRGASTAATAAGTSVFVGGVKVGTASFSGTTPSIQDVQFQLNAVPAIPKIRFYLETDSGANDTKLDWYELTYVGPIPPPPPAPILPTQGAFFSGQYRNLFAEAGYAPADITAKVTAAYNQLFHSTQTDRITGQAIFITDPLNTNRAYIWDTGNNDVRSEGMSYGMMMAVQMNRQDDFNKLWAWANHYMLNTSGDMKGYYGWQKNTDGSNRDVNPAPDGEEYFVTALFLASHRWGDTTGIYNYKAEANKLLDNMFDNGQSHYVNGQLVNFSLFDKTANQILFSPYGPAHTDPSYHLPAFYELWARWATNNKAYWAQLATISRAFWKTTVNPVNGLNPNYANFDGSVVTTVAADHRVFFYDAWRTIGNAATDYAWFLGDPWEVTYAKTLHSFLKSKGINNYPSLYNMDGTPYNGNTDHSPGLVGMNAMGALASDSSDAWDFVKALWDTPVPTGQYRYYDGSLYMFSLMAVSGQYKIYCPGNVVCSGTASSTPASSAAASSLPASSTPASSTPASSTPASSRPASSLAASSVAPSSSPISSAAASSTGIRSAYTQIEAESYNQASGSVTKPAGDGGVVVNFGTTSDWIKFNNIDFGTAGAGNVNIRSTDVGYGANIEIYIDSPTGTKVATVYPNGGSVYTTAANQVYPKPTGVHNVYIKVTSANVKINWLKFLQ
jgi:oligosaccharide reducing-end xylanase